MGLKSVKKELKSLIFDSVNFCEPLAEAVSLRGFANTLYELEINYSLEEIRKYYLSLCQKYFTNQREKISQTKFHLLVFGKGMGYCKYKDCGKQEHEELVNSVIDEVYKNQIKTFIGTNVQEMNLNNDCWRLFFLKGPSLYKRDFDFSQIKVVSLRQEVKMYFKHLLLHKNNYRNDCRFALIVRGVNYISSKYPEVTHFRDINSVHINDIITTFQTNDVVSQFGTQLTVGSIRKTKEAIGSIIAYLMTLDNYYYRPHTNPTTQISFKNASAMEKRTDIIPEEILSQIDKVYTELIPDHQLLYEILKNTGLRIKEISHLKSNCLTKSKDDGFFMLEYTPYKIQNYLKKQGKPLTQSIAITADLAAKIQKRRDESEEFRQISNTDYIFLTRKAKTGDRISIIEERNFVEAINRLIKKHDIKTFDGAIWKYTSRQSRKTIGVLLAENGATTHEIAAQFGHMDMRTTEKYYAEVRQKKLAELNSEFFKKQFALFVGEKNLELFSEEERRQLYVDFALNNREVELGQCLKHISEGACGKRTGKSNCATCPKLCTGRMYLDKWIKLRDSQCDIVNALLEFYTKENIKDYENYVEYKKELYLYKIYSDVVEKILNDGEMLNE